MQTDGRPFDFLERIIREGGPIPFVQPDDIKKMWKFVRDCAATTTIGLGVSAGLGLSDPSLDGSEVLGVRLNLMRSLFERGVLRDHLVDGEMSDEVFRAAATMPCEWKDFCEAGVQLLLKTSSEETVSKAREMFGAQGYDPDKPKIDSKFLAWMRDQP
jgi:hypothetical protein